MTSDVPTVTPIMAVRNRADVTEKCLSVLLAPRTGYRMLPAVVVDDGSTDRTPEMLREFGDRVRVCRTDGNAYWAGGMRIAEKAALSNPGDYILWVNDDADLDEDAVQRLVETHRSLDDPRSIVTGVMVSPSDSRKVTYGGLRQPTRLWYKFTTLPLSDRSQRCAAANGNLLLVPVETYGELGGIDSAFTHHYGDWDFTLRASKQGIPVVVAPGRHGSTELNGAAGTAADQSLTPLQRWRLFLGPKCAPPREELLVLRRHALLWPLQFVRIYAGAAVKFFIIRKR